MSGQHGCRRVLIVDDEYDIREAIAEVLGDQDYSANTASNGKEALAQLHAMDEKPCVILLDLTMPIMNGFEFRAVQRADPALQSIPVIIVTAHFQAAEVADLAVAAFVRKPLNPEELLHTVKVACGRSDRPDDAWRRVSGDPERWERAGFGAVEARGPALWAAQPTCGHDHYSALTLAEARQQLDDHTGLCFMCWYRIGAFQRALRRGQSTPPDGSPLD